MKLTTADLDRLPESNTTYEEGNNYYDLTRELGDALIAAARLQVAIDELPLKEGWCLRLETFPLESVATAWLYMHDGRSEPQVSRPGPTMLDVVLALDAALRGRVEK